MGVKNDRMWNDWLLIFQRHCGTHFFVQLFVCCYLFNWKSYCAGFENRNSLILFTQLICTERLRFYPFLVKLLSAMHSFAPEPGRHKEKTSNRLTIKWHNKLIH